MSSLLMCSTTAHNYEVYIAILVSVSTLRPGGEIVWLKLISHTDLKWAGRQINKATVRSNNILIVRFVC